MNTIKEDIYFRCKQHTKKLQYICSNCNEIICLDCIPDIKHKGHIFEDVNSIRQFIFQNKDLRFPFQPPHQHEQNKQLKQLSNEINNTYSVSLHNSVENSTPHSYNYINRLLEIWSSLKELVKKHQLYEDTSNFVNEFYRDIHEYLRLEEFKIMKPIRSEKDKAEEIIQSLVEEAKSINVILVKLAIYHHHSADTIDYFKLVNNDNYNYYNKMNESKINNSGLHGNCYTDAFNYQINNIINGIHSSTNIYDFINKNKMTIFSKQDTDSCDNEIFDILAKIRNYQKSYPYEYKLPIPYQIRFDELKLQDIKTDLQKLYELVNAEEDVDNLLSNDILFSVGPDGSKMLDIGSRIWIEAQADSEHRPATLNSIIQVGEYVYVFGGGEKNSTYSRYSLRQHQWDSHGEVMGGGGDHVCTCFDGRKYIYLFGGFYNLNHLSRVVRFDTETNRFENVGDFGVASTCAYIFYYENSLYLVGGDHFKKHYRSVWKMDLETKIVTIFIKDIEFSTHTNSVCYGDGFIYILDADSTFYRFSLNDRMKTILKSPFSQYVPYKSQMVYSDTGHIYYISGTQYGNHYYSIHNDTWMKINDKDTINRSCAGSALIRNLKDYNYSEAR